MHIHAQAKQSRAQWLRAQCNQDQDFRIVISNSRLEQTLSFERTGGIEAASNSLFERTGGSTAGESANSQGTGAARAGTSGLFERTGSTGAGRSGHFERAGSTEAGPSSSSSALAAAKPRAAIPSAKSGSSVVNSDVFAQKRMRCMLRMAKSRSKIY